MDSLADTSTMVGLFIYFIFSIEHIECATLEAVRPVEPAVCL